MFLVPMVGMATLGMFTVGTLMFLEPMDGVGMDGMEP
jgi:hypothetical protein